MHEVLVNCLFKLDQEKVWLGDLIVAVDLERKATKQTNKQTNITSERAFSQRLLCGENQNSCYFLSHWGLWLKMTNEPRHVISNNVAF